jgi:phage internal scaffolding protein
MGKDYCEKYVCHSHPTTSPEMRQWCQRPGNMDELGNPIYLTEQAHKDACDVNKIIRKYDTQGLISHISKFEAKFGDLTGLDFKAANDLIAAAKSTFENLPSEIRNRFKNSPEELLTFMENPENRDEAIKLGLIKSTWTEATDGLGEHVQEGQNIDKDQVTE